MSRRRALLLAPAVTCALGAALLPALPAAADTPDPVFTAVTQTGELYGNASGTAVRLAGGVTAASYGPGATALYYATADGVYAAAPDGTDPVLLAALPLSHAGAEPDEVDEMTAVAHIAPSPDGAHIALGAPESTFLLDPSGAVTASTNDVGVLHWLPGSASMLLDDTHVWAFGSADHSRMGEGVGVFGRDQTYGSAWSADLSTVVSVVPGPTEDVAEVRLGHGERGPGELLMTTDFVNGLPDVDLTPDATTALVSNAVGIQQLPVAGGEATDLWDAPLTGEEFMQYPDALVDVATVPSSTPYEVPEPQLGTPLLTADSTRELGGFVSGRIPEVGLGVIGVGCAVLDDSFDAAPEVPDEDGSLLNGCSMIGLEPSKTYHLWVYPYALDGSRRAPWEGTITTPAVAKGRLALSGTVVPGHAQTLTASFTQAGQPVRSRPVTLFATRPGADPVPVSSRTTDALGVARFSVTKAGSYVVGLRSGPRYGGDGPEEFGDYFAVTAVAAPRKATLSAPKTARSRHSFVVTSVVSPAAKVGVLVQELRGRTWVTVAKATTSSTGRAASSVTLTGAGKHSLRTVASAVGGWAGSVSGTVTVTVR